MYQTPTTTPMQSNCTAILGTHDANTLAQLDAVAVRAAYVALMADGHFGYVMPVGGVAAYRNQVSIAGVGVDQGCGNCALRTDIDAADLTRADLEALADNIQRSISFGMGRTNSHDDSGLTDHELFDSPAWDVFPRRANVQNLKQTARNQLGTVGGGNHYVDVFADQFGKVWIGNHFGSRGLGFKTFNGFNALAAGLEWDARTKETEQLLDLDTWLGEAYWASLQLCLEYAATGRYWVASKVLAMLGGRITDVVHNHHNAAWFEQHFGENLVVVRKGATPAFPEQRGFVGGSMGDNAVILRGRNSPTAANLMYSTVHGAGRVMSRTAARGKLKGWGPRAKLVAPGCVSQDMMDDWVNALGVVRRGGGVDESPHVYRRLPAVLEAQGDTIEVEYTLRPLVVVMAAPDVHDPFKD